jgi:LCP family protein required for cell wall assembly
MSDGDNATPGRRRASESGPGHDADNQWLTRNSRPSLGAAPWERLGSSDSGSDPAADEPTGNHADGVTVADLIAKLTGDGNGLQPEEPKRHRAESEREPEPWTAALPRVADEPPEELTTVLPPVEDDHDDGDDTEIIPAAALRSEVPDLTARRRFGRVAPTRIDGDGPVAPTTGRRNRRKAMAAGRTAAALIAASALVLTGGAWQWQSQKNDSLNKVAALDPNSRDILNPNGQYGDENFLIVGVDSRIGANAGMGAGDTEDAAGSRSDTVMLVNIPANRKRVVAVSFPRDLAITPMKCEAWDPQTGAYGPVYDEQSETYGPDKVYTETKLNSAYSFGGPKCLVKVIQKLSGLSINRFMAVDFAGFAKMVDALGGVEVCSTTPLKDYELGSVLEHAGRQVINGHTALNYVRARQVITETNGDYGRIKRQQRFLSSLLRSLISKEVFFSLSKLNNVVNMFIDDSYVDNIKTKDLVDLGQSIQGVNAGRITFVTVPTTGVTDSDGNEPPRTSDVKALFDAIINDDPLPEEKNPDNTPVPGTPKSTTSAPQATPSPAPTQGSAEVVNAITTDPHDINVRVSNSTGQDGLAATAATQLEQHGFVVDGRDDYPTSLTATTVLFSPGNEQAAATVASAFTNPTIERVSGMGNTIQVVLGNDFGSVSAPQPSGSQVQVNVLRGTSSTPTHLPEDLTVTNAADTTCE